jgi:hypothetical protein
MPTTSRVEELTQCVIKKRQWISTRLHGETSYKDALVIFIYVIYSVYIKFQLHNNYKRLSFCALF